MKTIQFLLPCFIALSFFSCKKSKTDTPAPPVVVPKVKTESLAGGDTYHYEYDSKGRISRLFEQVTGHKTEYDYSSVSKVVERSYNAAGTITNQRTHELNGQGLAESVTTVLPVNGLGHSLEYTSSKQMSRRVQTSPTSLVKFDTRYYYGMGGRLDSSIIEHTNTTGVIDNRYRYRYTYSITKPNSIANENLGYLFLGKQTSSPYDKETYTNLLFPLLPATEVNFTYEYDVQNRIIKVTRTPQPPDAPLVTTYTYY